MCDIESNICSSALGYNVFSAVALGDCLGLPFENLKRPHVQRLLAKTSVRQIILSNGKAIVSDDTEHAMFTALALVESDDNATLFERALQRQLVRWCQACPPGVGRATLRSCFKMTCGVSPAKAGIRSAGNGPLMRVPAIAIRYRYEPDKLREFVQISTSMTHTDPRATVMAIFLAEVMARASKQTLTWEAAQSSLDHLLQEYDCQAHEAEIRSLMAAAGKHDPRAADVHAAMSAIGCRTGVTGYILHTTIAAIWIAIKSEGDVREAINIAIECGGDTDSLAAVAGALTACSPKAIMPKDICASYAGRWADKRRMEAYAAALDPEGCHGLVAIMEPSIGQQFSDNMRALKAMVRHIFWRRLY